MRIVIAGCGDVGSALGRELTAAGHEVWGLRRNPAALPPEIQPLAADLGDWQRLAEVMPERLDAVVYTAAAGGYNEERYRAVYLDGVANVLSTLTSTNQKLQRFILVSSTSVHPQRDGEWIDETSAVADDSEHFANRSILGGERLAWDSPYPATVVRFGGIYGPGRTRLIDSLRDGSARCTPGVYSNRIHRDDCAGFLAHLLTLPQPQPLYLGVDDTPVKLCDVLAWLAEQLGLSFRPPHSTDGDSSMAKRLRSNKRCSNARLRASGYRLRYPSYRDGYSTMLDRQ